MANANVGLTEAQARERYGDYAEVERYDYATDLCARVFRKANSFAKLAFHNQTSRILVSVSEIVGVGAAQVIETAVLVVSWRLGKGTQFATSIK